MMKLSASQAAKKTGKSIPTITRAIKSGKLSGVKLDGGGYEIDASELFRVFQAVTNESDEQYPKLGHETHSDVNVLQMKVEFLEQRLADREKDLEKAEMASERMHELFRDTVIRLEAPKPKGWLARLFGS